MKKTLFVVTAVALAAVACNNTNKEDEQAAQAMQDATKVELQGAIADRDSLLGLVNQISADMDQIKRLENILSLPSDGENPNRRADIRADISALQQTLEQRRVRLAELEEKLNKSNLTNSGLRKTIETLRMQIDSQSAEIETLRQSLEEAHANIGRLNQSVDSLSATVDTVTTERDAARLQSVELTNELNTCYYVIASNKELKAHNIVESGFLRKTKLLKGDFDQSYFTVADKRDLKSLPLHSSKCKVLTNQPQNSYEIVDVNGQKVLRVLNPTAFWSLTNYLVVEID